MRWHVIWACVGIILAAASPKAEAFTVGAAIEGPSLSRSGEGDLSFDVVSGVTLELSLFRAVFLGAGVSWLSTGSDETQRVINGYVLAEFFPVEAITPYLRVGGGAYTENIVTSFGSYQSGATAGLFVGLGSRVYVKRYLSLSLEVQYHYTDLATETGFDSRDSVFRVLVGVALWWSTGG